MGILAKLFGSAKAAPVVEALCPHTALVPRWDSADDIGHEDRTTVYVCEACHETFTPEEAAALRDTAVARLVGGGPDEAR